MVGRVYINCELIGAYRCRGGLEAFVERVWFQAGTCAGMFFICFLSGELVAFLPLRHGCISLCWVKSKEGPENSPQHHCSGHQALRC